MDVEKERAQQDISQVQALLFPAIGALIEVTPLLASHQQHMQPFQVEGQAHQTPLACGRR